MALARFRLRCHDICHADMSADMPHAATRRYDCYAQHATRIVIDAMRCWRYVTIWFMRFFFALTMIHAYC